MGGLAAFTKQEVCDENTDMDEKTEERSVSSVEWYMRTFSVLTLTSAGADTVLTCW